MFFRQIVQETIVLVTVLITYMKKFSILIGWEQCSFEEIQCRKQNTVQKNENTVQIQLHKIFCSVICYYDDISCKLKKACTCEFFKDLKQVLIYLKTYQCMFFYPKFQKTRARFGDVSGIFQEFFGSFSTYSFLFLKDFQRF